MNFKQDWLVETTAAVAVKLKEAGLPTDPYEVIGGLFVFRLRGSLDFTMMGTIQGLEIAVDNCLELSVSNPEFQGSLVEHIFFTKARRWAIRLKTKSGQSHTQSGEFGLVAGR